MSNIRRQSIISSAIVYIGFALGFLNTYLFAREGGFTPSQYGLTNIFIAIASIMYSLANLGMQSYIYKFYPYYKGNLNYKENDMMTVALLVSMAGFVMVMVSGIAFRQLVIQKFGEHSPELVKYYYWIFPFGFGLTIYSLLEAFAWQAKKSVLTNYLREVQFRVFTTALILLSYAGIVRDFSLFIHLYAFTYLTIAAALLIYLVATKKLHFTFSFSRVTRKFVDKIVALCSFVWGGGLVFNLSTVFDSIVIAAVVPDGMAYVGVYSLAQNISSLIQAPQRGVISAALGPLSQAWKEKDYERINRIYHRSSINQLVFSIAMFVLIWINFTDGVITFSLKKTYFDAQYIFLFIGLMRIVDLGTGLNAQIIATSNYWRFEFLTGTFLLLLTLPMNYLLAKQLGAVGPAIANLITFSIYNAIRYVFLLRKFGMQPFTPKTLYTLLLGVLGFFVSHYLFKEYQGLQWIVIRSAAFLAIYGAGIIYFDISPDVMPVWKSIKGRVTGRRR